MGDRRKGDRRAPEEGVFRIQKKKVGIYAVLIVILVFAVILNIISWKKYFETREKYDTVIDHYYNDETNNSTNTKATTNNTETSNNYSCDISINGNKESIKPGESIEYEIRVSNINAEGGIKTFEAYLDYDSSKFDCRVESDKDKNWSVTSLLKNYLTMDRSDFKPSNEDQVIAKLVFTAKKDLAAGTYKAKLSKMEFISGDSKIFEKADNTIDIMVK